MKTTTAQPDIMQTGGGMYFPNGIVRVKEFSSATAIETPAGNAVVICNRGGFGFEVDTYADALLEAECHGQTCQH